MRVLQFDTTLFCFLARVKDQQCVLKRVLGFPPGQRRDGGVAVTVAALGVCRERRLFPLLLLAVRVVHRQGDERGGLPAGGENTRQIHEAAAEIF